MDAFRPKTFSTPLSAVAMSVKSSSASDVCVCVFVCVCVGVCVCVRRWVWGGGGGGAEITALIKQPYFSVVAGSSRTVVETE